MKTRRAAEPLEARDVMMEAMVVSALDNAAAAERYGLRRDQIILSAKVSSGAVTCWMCIRSWRGVATMRCTWG